MRVATISFAELHVRLLFKGNYSLIPMPFEGEKKGPVTDCTCMCQLPQENLGYRKRLYEATPIMTLPCTLGHGRRVKKCTAVCGTPGFLGVVGTCACNRYQALSPPPQRACMGMRLGQLLIGVQLLFKYRTKRAHYGISAHPPLWVQFPAKV